MSRGELYDGICIRTGMNRPFLRSIFGTIPTIWALFSLGCLNTVTGRPVDGPAACLLSARTAGETLADACTVGELLAVDRRGTGWLFETDCIPDGWSFCKERMASAPCCALDIPTLPACLPDGNKGD